MRLRLSAFLPVVLVSGVVFMGSALPAEEPSSNPFTFGLGVNSPTREQGRRFDVLSGSGVWAFQIVPTGTVSTLVLSIRDSSPGDFCWFLSIKKPQAGLVTTQQIIPAATLNACPGSQFEDVNGAPLAFYAAIQGGKSGGVTITVTYPNPSPAP